MEKIDSQGDPIEKILERKNILVIDEKRTKEYQDKYGKNAFAVMEDPFLENVFDTWFYQLNKELQYSYLEDATQLLINFTIENENLIGEKRVHLQNLESEAYKKTVEYVYGGLERILNKLKNKVDYSREEINYIFPQLKKYDNIHGNIDELQVIFEEMICEGSGDKFEVSLMHTFVDLCGEYRKLDHYRKQKNINKIFPIGSTSNIKNDIKNYMISGDKIIPITSTKKIGTKEEIATREDGTVDTFHVDMHEVTYKPYADSEMQIDTISEYDITSLINGIEENGEPTGESNILEYYNYDLQQRTLSKENYDLLFNSGNVITQGNIGDCYLINTLNSLRNNQYIEGFLSSNIKITEEGNYSVSLPLGSTKNTKEILVSPSDITNKDLLIGDTGRKVLEVAYLKLRAEKRGEKAYMKSFRGKDPLNTEHLESGTLEEVTKEFLGKLAYIRSHEFKAYNKYTDSKRSSKPEYKRYLEQIEEEYKQSLSDKYDALPDLMVAAKFKTSANEYVKDLSGNEIFLPNKHGYTVLELKTDSVLVANPHDPSHPFRLDKKSFLMAFDQLNIVQIDLEKFFVEKYK